MNPDHVTLPFEVHVLSSVDDTHQTIATAVNRRIAEAAFEAAALAYPTCRLQLREGHNLIDERMPGQTPARAKRAAIKY